MIALKPPKGAPRPASVPLRQLGARCPRNELGERNRPEPWRCALPLGGLVRRQAEFPVCRCSRRGRRSVRISHVRVLPVRAQPHSTRHSAREPRPVDRSTTPRDWIDAMSIKYSDVPTSPGANGYGLLTWTDSDEKRCWAEGARGQFLLVNPDHPLVVVTRNDAGVSLVDWVFPIRSPMKRRSGKSIGSGGRSSPHPTNGDA